MPAINFCRQTQLDFLSAISITYSNTFPALSAVSTIYFEKKKKMEIKKYYPSQNMSPALHHMAAQDWAQHIFLW